jgi:hypothetical protein
MIVGHVGDPYVSPILYDFELKAAFFLFLRLTKTFIVIPCFCFGNCTTYATSSSQTRIFSLYSILNSVSADLKVARQSTF